MSALWLCLALLAWVMLSMAERVSALGLPRLPLRRMLAAAGAVFCIAEVPAFALSELVDLARSRIHTVAAYSGTGGHSSLVGDISTSLAAGLSEEVVVLVLPVLAAWRIGQHITNSRVRSAGTVALVVLLTVARLSYHMEYGLALLPLIPWAATCVLLYLRSRAILPLMIAHAGYDLTVDAINRLTPRYGPAAGVYTFAGVASVAFIAAMCLQSASRRFASAP
ncbi:hypothetical protein LN042_23925 [Kitasatospora sp. RB6PN24]|uniref:CPBP family glutamic-type intramembrane protease n=1 Tax=Kitasatospora humi TaxID=2893891 RepID=UPI001E6382BB|nr:CPBP family glutamic-type intramembrane protease [Kitasatospora humi]MCC9310079.1 hypothetical protein [Kitasatospora humi]